MELNKSKKIKSLIQYLSQKYKDESFKITDYWDADLDAIGFSDKTEKYLVYISVYGKGDKYYVELENPPKDQKAVYDLAGSYDNLRIEEVEKLFVKHLRINEGHV